MAFCYDHRMSPHDQQRFAKLVSEFIDGCRITVTWILNSRNRLATVSV